MALCDLHRFVKVRGMNEIEGDRGMTVACVARVISQYRCLGVENVRVKAPALADLLQGPSPYLFGALSLLFVSELPASLTKDKDVRPLRRLSFSRWVHGA